MQINELKTGDTLCIQMLTFVGKAEQLFTRSTWSHTASVHNHDNNITVTESRAEGYELNPMDAVLKRKLRRIIVKRPRFSFDHDSYEKNAHEWVGKKPYGFFKLLFLQPLHQFFEFVFNVDVWFGFKGKLAEQNMICSQSCLKLYEISANKDFKSYEAAPVDIAENFTDFDTYELEFK
jgi:hypothetical protein